MPRMRVIAAAACLGLAAGVPSLAAAQVTEQTFRGARTADLASLCAADQGDPNAVAAQAWCQGFIVSAAQYHGALAAADPARGRIYCQPDPNITLDQVRTAFLGWAQAHPQYGSEKAVDGLLRFAAATWPCPTQARRR